MSEYKLAKSTDDVKKYLENADIISFDFETAPDDEYRDEPMAAIDPHKSHIVGVSFAVKAGTGIYVPIAHKNTSLNSCLDSTYCPIRHRLSSYQSDKPLRQYDFQEHNPISKCRGNPSFCVNLKIYSKMII